MGNTLIQINEESLEQQKIFPSLRKDNLKEYTISAGGSVNGAEAAVKISSSKKAAEAFGEFSYTNDGEGISLSAFLNDDGFGIGTSSETNEYFTLPSTITAEDWNNSALRAVLGADEIDSDLDISYSALSEELNSQKTKTQLYDRTKALNKYLEFSDKESTSLVINGKNTKVKKLTFTIDGEAFKEYANDLFDIVQNDERLPENTKETLDEISDSFDDNIDFGDVKVVVYSTAKKAVEVKISIPVISGGKKIVVDMSLTAAQTENMINNYKFEIAVNGGEKPINISLNTFDNGEDEDYDCAITRTLNISSPDEMNINISNSFTYRKSDGALSGNISVENGERTEIRYSGTLIDKNGFSLELPDITVMSGGEPVSAELYLKIVPEITEEIPEDIIENSLLDMSEDEILSALSVIE
ncbi:MAG: hypothetical protein LUD03_06660 [Firmicutes bacterium]|nr:hypothetical protein [Bacillota bacterium]